MDSRPILIIEDETELAEILGEYLKVEGYDTVLAFDGEEGLNQFFKCNPQMILLDIMLPKLNGVEVCKKIRAESEQIPILMLSAKNGEMDKVISLGAGADDYVTKPFSPLELVARVKAQLRRYKLLVSDEEKKEKTNLSIGRVELFPDSYEAYVDEKQLVFTTKEFEMLSFFAANKNRVFSKEQIYEHLWGMNEYGDISSVAVYIKRIRTKLEPFGMELIKTVWGAGYKGIDEG